MMKQWKLLDKVPDLSGLAKKIGASELIAGVLWHRGIRTAAAAKEFLQPEKQPFYDPYLMKDMDKAVARIITAIEQEEHITVYGDYDVDGMTATSLMLHNLRALGGKADFYIPDRQKEGYGLNLEALQYLAEQGTKLLLTVDCGIASVADVAAMKGKLDIIITDHHLPGAVLPEALAVVNPHRADCEYPDKNLAGVGVAFKLCQALWQKLENEKYERDLELVALGTVADVVPLLGENRHIVKTGLENMTNSTFAGIRALLKAADISDSRLNTGHVGFRLAPRLNAAGRIGSAVKGVHLLLAKDEGKAMELAMELDMLNSQRQAIEQEILQKAEASLKEQDLINLPAIVVAGENWNSGVIGIVASRLVDKYYKPVVVFSIQEDGVCKGSCRSIDGFNMYEALKLCQDYIIKFGGHAQAAGLSVAIAELDDFKQAFYKVAAAKLTPDDYIPKVEVEAELEPSKVTIDLVEELDKLEPYGMGNPKPLFGWKNIRAKSAMAIGSQGQHLRFQIGTDEALRTALFWNQGSMAGIVNAENIDIVYSPAINEWQGRRSLQCMINALNPAAGEKVFPERETLAEIYRLLYQIQQQEGKIPYNATELTIQFNQQRAHISLYTLSIGLRIFQELGILRTNLTEESYYLPKVTTKMDLSNSPTFSRH